MMVTNIWQAATQDYRDFAVGTNAKYKILLEEHFKLITMAATCQDNSCVAVLADGNKTPVSDTTQPCSNAC
jgi:hypothetical protein